MYHVLSRRSMRRRTALLLLLCLFLSLCAGAASAAGSAVGLVLCETKTDDVFGSYVCVTVRGLTPYVFVPTGAGSADAADYASVSGMVAEYGDSERIVAAVNGGIFYNAGTETQYCFRYKQPDGVVIADGVVLKSAESIDHSECDILVIDEDGHAGWTDFCADADALAAGDGYYYDVFGNVVTGKQIVSAVTGFVPILVGGEPVYDEGDEALHGFDNYVGHYTQSAARQIFGVREDGAFVLLANLTGWTLEEAALAALSEGCVFAYNLDGGGSAETVLSGSDGVTVARSQSRGERSMPTYIVFTGDDEAPVSAEPFLLTAGQRDPLPAGASLSDIAAALDVTEYLRNADDGVSVRALTSAQAAVEGPLVHGVMDASGELRKTSLTPGGVPYYTKTAEDEALSLRNNANTRQDGVYHDYSTGFTVVSGDDLSTPGVKRVTVTYAPGGDRPVLTCAADILLG